MDYEREDFLYPDAGDNAAPGVQDEIDEFRELPIKERARGHLWGELLGSGTPPYKFAKGDVDYIDVSDVPGQRCGNCRFGWYNAIDGRMICSQVRGEIEPEAWCNRWAAAKKVGNALSKIPYWLWLAGAGALLWRWKKGPQQ